EARLAAPQAFGSEIIRPVQRRPKNSVVHAGKIQPGNVQDGDHVTGRGALEVLVARSVAVEEKPVHALGEKRGRPHFRVHGLGKRFGKSLAECEGTQVLERCHAADIVREHSDAVELNVLATLVDFAGCLHPAGANCGLGSAAVENLKVAKVDKRGLTGCGPKTFRERPTTAGKILSAQSGVHAAVDGPVERGAHDSAFGGGKAAGGNQKTAFPSPTSPPPPSHLTTHT